MRARSSTFRNLNSPTMASFSRPRVKLMPRTAETTPRLVAKSTRRLRASIIGVSATHFALLPLCVVNGSRSADRERRATHLRTD